MSRCPICGKDTVLDMYIVIGGGRNVCRECYTNYHLFDGGEISFQEFITTETDSIFLDRMKKELNIKEEKELLEKEPCDFCGKTNDTMKFLKYKDHSLILCSNCKNKFEFLTNYDYLDTNLDNNALEKILASFKNWALSIDTNNSSIRGKEVILSLQDKYSAIINKWYALMVTTGYNFENYTISKYLGIVNAECIIGTGLFSEMSSTFHDTFGTESKVVKSKLSRAKSIALDRLKLKAVSEDADGIIGIDYDIITLKNDTIVVSVNGTIVKIQ